ncbi:MAG TPA: peptidylprolyl isomerase, partial [Clostridia bacterium]
DEYNKFYLKYRNNSKMMYKTDEEINDMVLDEVINRAVIEDYLYNKSGQKVSKEEASQYFEKYIKPSVAINGGEELGADAQLDYKTDDDRKKEAEEFLLKLKVIPGIAKEYGIDVSSDELDTKYNESKIKSTFLTAQHILISTTNRKKEEALSLANDIYDKLSKGGSFEELAKKYSDDKTTKDSGGGLGKIGDFLMGKQFYESVVSNAQPKTLMKPTVTEKGVEIVYVSDVIRLYHPKDEYRNILIVGKFSVSDKLKDWTEKLKKESKIEILDPALNAYRLYKSGDYAKAAEEYSKAYKKYGSSTYQTKEEECKAKTKKN